MSCKTRHLHLKICDARIMCAGWWQRLLRSCYIVVHSMSDGHKSHLFLAIMAKLFYRMQSKLTGYQCCIHTYISIQIPCIKKKLTYSSRMRYESLICNRSKEKTKLMYKSKFHSKRNGKRRDKTSNYSFKVWYKSLKQLLYHHCFSEFGRYL